MSSQKLECSVCGESTSIFFLTIGDKAMICMLCKNKHKGKIPQFQKPQTFVRYICKTHDCGTYSVRKMMNTHEMKDCVIISQVTLGIIRPATFGGFNGDISRKYYLGINEIQRLETNLANYKRFAFIHNKARRAFNGRKISYHDKKYYNKHLRYLGPSNPDHHKNDELLKRLKFNLNVFISSLPKRFYKPVLSQKDRSELYYADLMKNFNAQVIRK